MMTTKKLISPTIYWSPMFLSATTTMIIIIAFIGGLGVDCRKDKIKLKDVQVLTLRPNEWTTGRRSSSVPQLKCIGGHCDAIRGQNVQCYNRGSDGRDVQWECKAQINSNYKFGTVDVICEGYDYPDDDYVLVGSCGLEYSIESSGGGGGFASDYVYSNLKSKPTKGFSFGFILTAVALIFIIYYVCLRRPNRDPPTGQPPRSSTRAPPPPGFRSDYYDNNSPGSGSGCGSSFSSSGPSYGFNTEGPQTRAANNGNGFFSGILAGGALGYLFGSRTNTNYNDQSSYFDRRHTRSSPFSSPSGGYSSSSSTTTTTSGFGGTKRR
ncbi:store-operated calcium entry-associated regulatory factor-like [Oppia nitens]|uniref:store-operated calcium entry-associated regulatory factor-like n=1 Tax=Oppia nitens TaxID=1686743 RepID=UPI0023DB47D6|nr:store-operated calcium entry-associated regulatory factor-like [Oppia nitens]